MESPGQSLLPDSALAGSGKADAPSIPTSLLADDLITDDQIMQAMKIVAARERGITATTLLAGVRDLLAPSGSRFHHVLWDAIDCGVLDFLPDSRLIVGTDG